MSLNAGGRRKISVISIIDRYLGERHTVKYFLQLFVDIFNAANCKTSTYARTVTVYRIVLSVVSVCIVSCHPRACTITPKA